MIHILWALFAVLVISGIVNLAMKMKHDRRFINILIDIFDFNHDKCYEQRKKDGVAWDQKCPGLVGGTKNTEYLQEGCIGCKYFTNMN